MAIHYDSGYYPMSDEEATRAILAAAETAL